MSFKIKQMLVLQDKLHDIGKQVADVMEKAKVKIDGMDRLDLELPAVQECELVKSLTTKTSVAIVDAIRQRNAEMDDLGKQIAALQEAQKGFDSLDERAKHYPHAGDSSKDQGNVPHNPRYKSAFQRIMEHPLLSEKGYDPALAKRGMTLSFPDMLPSEFLAMGHIPETIGMKALMETTAGWAPESVRLPGFVEMVSRPIQLLDIMPLGRTGQEKIVYMEETTRTHASLEKAEGAAFAESAFAMTERESNVRKITDSIPVTDEQLEDVAFVASYIRDRLTFGLRQRLDRQVQAGTGVAPLLLGLNTLPGIQTQAKGGDPIPDAYYKAMTLIRTTGRAIPTHSLIHPTNWQSVRLLRTADGVYIWGNPSEAGPERMWGLPIVLTEIEAAGTGYVGSFVPAWCSLFERKGIDVQIGYVGSQFTEGKRTIRADTRFALVFFRPAAFCKVTGL